jgi:hypothetical protein
LPVVESQYPVSFETALTALEPTPVVTEAGVRVWGMTLAGLTAAGCETPPPPPHPSVWDLQLELHPLVVVQELEQVVLQRWEQVFEVAARMTGLAVGCGAGSSKGTESEPAMPFMLSE